MINCPKKINYCIDDATVKENNGINGMKCVLIQTLIFLSQTFIKYQISYSFSDLIFAIKHSNQALE
jgi:hypothetical protein